MKKLLAILIISLASLTAFAQGKISFGNDSLHLVYYNPAVFGAPLGGTPVDAGTMPVPLAVDLYLGTASSSLSLTSTTLYSGTPPGTWPATSVAVPLFPGGTTLFVKIQVRDFTQPAEALWTPSFVPPEIYWGFSVEFPFTLGSGVIYPSIVAPPNPPWPIGDFLIGDFPFGGARGAIPFGYIPEPSAIALAGLGALAMLFRKPLISKLFKAFQS
jgi:hypothetical protein